MPNDRVAIVTGSTGGIGPGIARSADIFASVTAH